MFLVCPFKFISLRQNLHCELCQTLPIDYLSYRKLNLEIKIGGPRTPSGARAPCLYPVNPYYITMIIIMIACEIHSFPILH